MCSKLLIVIVLVRGVLIADSLTVRNNSVAFLGLQSISDNRFHITLEDRIYAAFALDTTIRLEPHDFYGRLLSRGQVNRKLPSMDEAVLLMNATGVRLFISGEIRNFKISLNRAAGFLPWGVIRGEIVCFMQVIDALERKTCFAGNLKFVVEKNAGLVWYSRFADERPLSPVEEKHFIFDLTNGLCESIVRTSQASYAGIMSSDPFMVGGGGKAATKAVKP